MIALGPTALAQQIQTLNLFKSPDSVDLRNGAAQTLRDAVRRAPGRSDRCPSAQFTIFTPPGDELFQQALATARRDTVVDALNSQGIDANSYSVNSIVFGEAGGNDASVEYGGSPDHVKPTINVIWTPQKNTKVSHGRKINAKALARDDADKWQSGIKTIDFDVQGGGQFGFDDYPRPPQNCENLPPPQTSEGVYTVPNPEPPIVRLRARTSDFAGHSAQDVAEFPTGDWFGKIKKQASGGGHNHTVTIDYTFDIDPSGTTKPRAYARIAAQPAQIPGCTFTWSYTPSELAIPISAERNGDNFQITIQAGETTAHIKSQCTASSGSNSFRPPGINPTSYGETKFSVPAKDGETRTVTINAGPPPWGVKMTDTIEIHKAR
jgi:hypothetical protein